MICFDWCFPEVARILALKDAKIICHPANLVLLCAPKMMLARSIENRVFTITAIGSALNVMGVKGSHLLVQVKLPVLKWSF